MLLQESLQTAIREIRAHKLRSSLSFLALAVGAASILYTFAQTHGMQVENRTQIELEGPGRLSISRKSGYTSKGLSPGLTIEDADAIRKAMPELYMVYPRVGNKGHAEMYYNGEFVQHFYVQGVGPEWRRRDWVYRLRGRFFDEADMREAARVCVVLIPPTWYKKPFWATWWHLSRYQMFIQRHDLLGKHIRLKDHDFFVVGTLEAPPLDLDPRWYHWNDPNVLVPATTLSRYFPDEDKSEKGATLRIDDIQVDTGDERTSKEARHKIEQLLKLRHRGETDFEVHDAREDIQEELNETKRYVIAGLVLGAIALFAGGIGIMNVTLAALFSRVKEIGIRRALGASKADILWQFVIEAALLGLAGGIAGVALGWAGTAYLHRDAERELASITWYHLVAVVLIGVVASAAFSLVPAWRAAQLDPVEALRSE